ncbi:2Fe-2S iron-sulfur cluster binding domain-containing protein [candidate division KSB1 bacterium]|nr:2Fe-2S iron-sulfur cluster binding domain-containing protein [candidate division KSB1 bacterium]
MPTVLFEAENRKVEVPAGTTLRKAAKKAGVSVYGGVNKIANCRGFGLCGTDRVAVAPADCANSMTFFEKLQLGDKAKERLACQVKIQGDVVINTAPAIEYGKVMTENFKFIALALPFGVLTLGAVIYMVFEMVGKPLF